MIQPSLRCRWLALGAAAILIPASIRAQDAARPPLASGEAIAVSARAGHALVQSDGELVGVGTDYKAFFRPGEVEFVPALGRAAPRNLPLTLRLGAVTRGDGTVVDGPTAAIPEHAGSTVSYARGAGLTERFEVRGDGLQWSLLCKEPLPGSGDLVLCCDLATELPLADPTAEGGAAFVLPELGGVTIGGVTGIDAAGRRVRGEVRPRASGVDLVLPAAFVEQAAYPLVLDPLVGAQIVITNNSGLAEGPVDIAYDATYDMYLVAWQRTYSMYDGDIRAVRIDGNGNLIGSLLILEIATAVNAIKPAVGNAATRDRFLVAWQHGSSPFGPWDIYGRTVSAVAGAIGSLTALAQSPADETELDAASDRFGDGVLLVWNESGAGIRGRRAQITTSGSVAFPTPVQQISNAPGARMPAISNSVDPNNGFSSCVGWVQNVLVLSMFHTALVDSSVSPGTINIVPFSNASDAAGLVVDGDGDSFVFAYEQEFAPGDRDILCFTRYRHGGSTWHHTIASYLALAPDDEREPAIAKVGAKYMVAYTQGGLTSFVRIREIGPRCEICGYSSTLSGGPGAGPMKMMPAIASRRSGGGISNDGMIAFVGTNWLPNSPASVVANRVTAYGTGGPITTVGTPCGTTATIGSSGGPCAVGNSEFRITVNNLPPGIAFGLTGFPGLETSCGSCVINHMADARFAFQVGGASSMPFAIPCDAAFVGLTVSFQWAILRTTPVNQCPQVAELATTQRLRTTIGW